MVSITDKKKKNKKNQKHFTVNGILQILTCLIGSTRQKNRFESDLPLINLLVFHLHCAFNPVFYCNLKAWIQITSVNAV